MPSIDVLLSRGICDYTLLPKTLGRGKFSTVFMASKNGEVSAIKHTALFPHHQLISTRLLREPTLLAELPPHPNLVAVKETIRTPGHFYLVEEYLGGYVTLEALLPLLCDSVPPVLPIPAAEKILTQLLSAVHSIHVPLQICHRDIKPENILVHPETLQLKLLDFGLATHFSKSEPKLSTCCGSPAFHCPEIVKALASPPGSVMYMGPEVDAWTCGVTMLRCLTGQRFPLGASHSSLRGMAIRAQRAVATIDDEGMRNKVAALLDMDGARRLRRFDELVAEQERVLGEPAKEAKKFKSTTFIPAEPTHSIKLPLLAPHLTSDASAWTSTGFNTPNVPASASRRSTPASSRPSSPSRSHTSAPPSPKITNTAQIVALNPTHQPPERVLSYIKYCLRCAGILYHTWPDTVPSSKDGSNSPVNYFGHAPPSASTLHASNAAFAEAVGLSSEQGSFSPVTPLFPSTFAYEDRQDGYGHVQVFQCVMEMSDEKEHKEQSGEQMSLVQSIMAAFGRRKPSPSTPTRPDAKRSLSTPAKSHPRDAVPGPGTPTASQSRPSANKDGPIRCLTFHLIVRFPKPAPNPASGRHAPSRASSSLSLAQPSGSSSINNSGSSVSHVNTSSLSSFGRHSRANSGGIASLPSELSPADEADEAVGEARAAISKRISLEGQQRMLTANKAHDSEATGLEINTDLGVATAIPPQAFPGIGSNRSPSSSRAPSRTRKRSHRGIAKKPKVLIQVTDQRALQAVRDALRVGGTVESLEGDDYFSFNAQRLSGSSNADLSGGGTPLAESYEPGTSSRGDQRRKARARASTSTSRLAQIAHSNSSTPRASMDLSSETPRMPRFRAADEEEHRGRQLNGGGGRGAGKDGKRGVRAPSQLSTVALKEESPSNDVLKQSIESLNAVLQSMMTNTRGYSTSPGTPSSGRSCELGASTNSTSSSSNASAGGAYAGWETGIQTQARTLLVDISRRLHAAERSGPSAVEDLISPLSFSLFSALSPTLGLEPQETRGLPTGAGLSTEVGEAVTLRGLGISALDVVARCASPREMFLASQERLELISSATRASKSPAEDEDGLLQVPSSLPPAETAPLSSEIWSSALETAGLVQFLSLVLPRIKTQKPESFIQPLTTLIPRAMRSALYIPASTTGQELISDVPSPSSSSPRTPSTDNDSSRPSTAGKSVAAGEMALALTRLTASIHAWVETFEKSEQGQARQAEYTLFFACIIVLMPELPKLDGGYPHLSDYHFYRWCPQYAFRRPLTPPQPAQSPKSPTLANQSQVWRCLEELVDMLDVGLEQCAFQTPKQALSGGDASSIAIIAMGAFILHVNLISRAQQADPTVDWSADEALDKLGRALPLLVASLGAGPPATASADGSHSLGGSAHLSDAALTWAIWCFQAMNRRPGVVHLDETQVLPALQTLSSHAAVSPNPSSRLICLTLVQTLLEKNVQAELGRDLLCDLVLESPFPQLRSASVGLAKRLFAADLDEVNSDNASRYARRDLLLRLSPALFSLPGTATPPSDGLDAYKSYLEDHGAWLSECLAFIYLVATKDVVNHTGIKDESTVNTMQASLLDPLEHWTDGVPPLPPSPSKAESELALQSSLLRLALDRAREAVGAVRG